MINNVCFWISIVFLSVGIPLVLSCWFNKYMPKWYGCELFPWHLAPTEQSFDGCSFHGYCPRCGKEVMQDGQGNWF